MQGTRIVIEATSPLTFGEDEGAKERYASTVADIVRAHAAVDVVVSVGETVEWTLPGAEPTLSEANEAQADDVTVGS